MPAPITLTPYVSVAAFFGAELRHYRERAGLTQEELAARVPWSASAIAKIERGERLPPEGFGAACDRVFGLDGPLSRLETLTHAAPNWFTQFVTLEAQAVKISMWDMRVVPGLLQTQAYAREVIRATTPFMPEADIEKAVAERMTRRSLLDHPDPPWLNVLLHEAVVRQPVGDLDIMKEQLAYLLELSGRPYINLRILPFSAGCVAGATGPFAFFEFPDQPPVGSAEGLGGGRLLDGAELKETTCIYDRIAAAALTPEQSAGLLRGALSALWIHPTR